MRISCPRSFLAWRNKVKLYLYKADLEKKSFFPQDRWKEANLEKNAFLDSFVAFGGGKHQCPGRSVKQLGFIYSQTLQRTTLLNWASLILGDKGFSLLFVSLLMFSIICTLFKPIWKWFHSWKRQVKSQWTGRIWDQCIKGYCPPPREESQPGSAPAEVSFLQGRVAPLPNTPFYRHSYLGCLKPILNKPTEHFSGLRLFPSSAMPLTSLLIFRYLNWLLSESCLCIRAHRIVWWLKLQFLSHFSPPAMPALVLPAFLLLFSLLSLFLEQVPGSQLLLIPVFKHLYAQHSAFKTWSPLRQKWLKILKTSHFISSSTWSKESGGCCRGSAFWNLHPMAG